MNQAYVVGMQGFPGGPVVKNLPANAEDMSLIPGLERSVGGGNGNTFQYFCLENPMDGGAWWATVHGVAKRWTCLGMHARVSTLRVRTYMVTKGTVVNESA